MHGQVTGTALDQITNKLYFVFPLRPKDVKFLNTVIYGDDLFWINYWSLTHFVFGLVWGLLGRVWPDILTLRGLLLFHTIFEIWEFWASGYFSAKRQVILPELVDVAMDTLFALAGFWASTAFWGPSQ